MAPFKDRKEAGQKLAEMLSRYAGRTDVLVLALPRGGVPVAREVARSLGAPLDIFLVRKLGVPGHREFAMGAIAPGGLRVLNEDVIRSMGITDEQIALIAAEEERELNRREATYRQGSGRPEKNIAGKTVIVVDDGMATGSTMEASVMAVRARRPKEIVVAVPVASRDAVKSMQSRANDVIAVSVPEPFMAVGKWYGDFPQTSDREVIDILTAGEE